MALVKLTAQIQFQSNSTRDNGCHLIILQFIKDNGDVLDDTPSGCPLKIFAIRLKNTTNNCNYIPDNHNPFIYNLNFEDNRVPECLLNGCVRKVRIIVVPCCRTSINVSSLSWTNDPDNQYFEIATNISCTTYKNYIPDNGGYAQMDVEIQNPTWYRCRKYKITTSLNAIRNNLRYDNCIDNIGGTSSTNDIPSIPVDSECGMDYVQNYVFSESYPFIICAKKISLGSSVINTENVTDKYTECCNCIRHNFSLTPGSDYGYLVIYQECLNGQVKIERLNINTSTRNFNVCAIKNSVRIIKYSLSGTICQPDTSIVNIPITYSNTPCNECNDLFIS